MANQDYGPVQDTVVFKVGMAIMEYLSDVPGLDVGDAMDRMDEGKVVAICGAVGSVAVDALATTVLGQTDLYEPDTPTPEPPPA